MAAAGLANARSRRTRENLLSAARTLLERRGPDAVTMAEVADLARVTRRAVYLHFPSRNALINALFDYVTEAEELDRGLEWVFAADGSDELVRRHAEFLVTYVPRILPVSKAVAQAAMNDEGAARHWDTAMAYRRRHAHELARRFVADDRLVARWSEADAAGMLLVLMSNDVIETLLHDCGWSDHQAAERLGTLISAAMLTESNA